MTENELSFLPAVLLPWFAENRRELPWRQDREPYHVWLSEIMLQQTRIEAVKGYFARFLAALPDIPSLANAPEELCHKLWEGLGYYSRVRNLRKAAVQIMEQHGGVFPRRYEDIRALAGVGDYTAGAVASICFGLPTPAVDGNVVRVCARLFSDGTDDSAFRAYLRKKLEEVYPAGSCGEFTQALMELGETLCVPNGVPRCEVCPAKNLCRSFADNTQMLYPVKKTKKPRRAEEKTVFLLRCGEKIAVRKRADTGLLAGLWEFPNVPGLCSVEQALRQAEDWGLHPLSPEKTTEKVHIFTHVEWKMRGWWISCASENTEFLWITEKTLKDELALPTAFRIFAEE